MKDHPIYDAETIAAMKRLYKMILRARKNGTLDQLLAKIREIKEKRLIK